MDICTFLWNNRQLFLGHDLGHFTYETHLVQRKLILPGRCLHDGSQERLWIEECREPERDGEKEISCPCLQFANSE